jgi:hypothetical protein
LLLAAMLILMTGLAAPQIEQLWLRLAHRNDEYSSVHRFVGLRNTTRYSTQREDEDQIGRISARDGGDG